MASKQPFRFFDWKQKLTRFYLRLNKTLSHKILAKSRNALLLKCDNDIGNNIQGSNFEDKLRNQLKKTWEIHQLDINKAYASDGFNSKKIESQFANKQYDAIIVLPNSNKNLKSFANIEDQSFAVDLGAYNKYLLTNLLAYRLAHKYLTTSGVLILSNSESDFAEVQNKVRVPQPHMKCILDAQISYIGVTIGDRDYTDLNSWSVIGLSQQFVNDEKTQDFVVNSYADWANGSNLPMPGSFALFKTEQKDKKVPFIQYL